MSPNPPRQSPRFGWRLHHNPLLRKSIHERLRGKAAWVWGLATFVIALWIFLMVFMGTTGQGLLERREAARSALVPLLVLQGILLMFFGTGAVAHGIATEKERGLLDYQRLTPMTALDKVLGYLFGLPIREYFAFAITFPFVLLAAVIGDIHFFRLGQLYLVFFTSVWLYHSTGLVAGMVSSHPRRANWFTRILVLGLYLFLPRMAALGFTVFGYLTILPTFQHVVIMEFGPEAAFLSTKEGWDAFTFFGVDLHPTLFTLLLQGGALLTFAVILFRKWRHDQAHSLSKVYAVALYAVLQLLLVGSLWSLITDPGRLPVIGNATVDGVVDPRFAMGTMIFVFWLLSLGASAALLHIITPRPFAMHHGRLRATRLGLARVPRCSDAASSLWCSLALGAITTLSFAILMAAAHAQGIYWPGGIPLVTLGAAPLIFFAVLIALQAVRQRYGGRGLALFLALSWVLPLMAMMLLGVSGAGDTFVAYVGLPAPVSVFFFLTLHLFAESQGDPVFLGLAVLLHLGFAIWATQQSQYDEAAWTAVHASPPPPLTPPSEPS